MPCYGCGWCRIRVEFVGTFGPQPRAIASGFERVVKLQRDMDQALRQRLQKLGFDEHEAGKLSALHTRNFI